ncbi:unnamed protein product [Merluccius merluccius]
MAVEFRTLAVESGWNTTDLRTAFLNTLHDSIKDKLTLRDDPGSVDELFELASRPGSTLTHSPLSNIPSRFLIFL